MAEAIELGSFRLDTEARVVTRGDGTRVALGTRALDLLLLLAHADGALVSKQVILDSVWPGLVVEENNIQVQVSALRRILGEQSIVTVPGRGYRLARPQAASLPPPEPSRPVLAVMPFSNIGSDPEQEHVVDGITEEIITAVGRARWFLVTGRNSAFAYKDRMVDLKTVGQELGVRYVLQGSVRRSGDRLRITAQLAETGAGTQVWAERFDGVWADVFELQDSIAASVAAAIEPKLRDVEIARAQRRLPGNLNAYDHYLRAMARFYRATQEDMAARLRDVEEAIALDPEFAPAHALAAQCLAYYVTQGFSDDPTRDHAEGARHARRALALDNGDPTVLGMAGHALGYHTHEWETSVHLLERSLVLNPSSALACSWAGWVNCYSGTAARALDHFDQALRLSPIDRHGFFTTSGKALALVMLADYDAAVCWGRRSVREQPSWNSGYRILAAALAQLGRQEEAAEVVRHVLERHPNLRISIVRSHYRPSEGAQRYLEGLLKAGVEA